MFASVGRAQILLNCLLVVRPHWITGISGSCRCKRCVRLLRWVPFVDCTSLRRGEYLMRDCGSPSCTLVHTTAAVRLVSHCVRKLGPPRMSDLSYTKLQRR